MKKSWIIGIVIFVMMILIAVLRFNPFSSDGGEDNWIKDSRGVYIKHGNPNSTLDYVTEQQNIIQKASELYINKKSEGMEFSSQCLGSVDDYAVDIVHVPRTSEDNLVENQCADYRNKLVSHFIELDNNGEIVRIV